MSASAGPPRPPGRRALLRGLALLIGTGVALLLVELSLRVLGVQPPHLLGKRWLRDLREPLVTYHCYPDNPSGELGPQPDLRAGDWHLYSLALPPAELPLPRAAETPFCVRYRRWEAPGGHKLREPAPAGPGGRRLLVVGDSFAFGEGVREEQTLRAALARQLGGHEVLSGARIGADTRLEVDMLTELAPALKADRALLVFIPNDVALTGELLSRQSFINDLINIRDERLASHEARAWYAGRSRLLRLLGATLAMQRIKRETVQWYLDSYDPAHNAANLQALQAALRRAAGLPGTRVALAIYPLLEGLEGRYPLAPVHARVAAMAREAGLPVLDLLPALSGRRAADLWVHPVDHHPNGKAHALAAQALGAWLRGLPGFLD